jgi:RluA family pseudouridine synthase
VDPAHPPPCSTNPPAPSLAAAEVLFLDGSLVVVNKPPGLPFHATPDPRRTSLVDVVKAWLQARTGERDPYLGTHQRLDRDTSGVVLFTLAREANAAMARAFETHQVTKRYHALVHVRGRRAPSSWSVENRLGVVGRGRHARVAVVADGDQASTTFRVLEHWGPVALVEACPRTGRKHQVRVHLAGSGMPILGDASYGQDDGVGRVMLHAHALGLPHPADGRPLFLEAPYPPDLAEELARCRGGPPGRPPARGAAPR